MSDKIDQVYGPDTLQFARFGIFTRLWLRFFVWTVYVHDSDEGTVVYKRVGSTMYVLGVARKKNQADRAEFS